MTSKPRSASYSCEEDTHLCRVYIDITQNPIIGINQSGERFWSRIQQEYNSSKMANMQERNCRSLECRMRVINKAVAKLRGAIRQIENLNRSGASEKDVYIQAKEILLQDAEYKRGYKFDHVWPVMKDIEKFAPNHGDSSSRPNSEVPETYISSSSPGLSSFSINLSDDSIPTPTSSKRPSGIKKAKLKRKQTDDVAAAANLLTQKTDEMVEVLKRKNDIREKRNEYKIMLTDINTITDPIARSFIENERARIMQKRGEEELNNANHFQNLFQNIGPSGNDLSDY